METAKAILFFFFTPDELRILVFAYLAGILGLYPIKWALKKTRGSASPAFNWAGGGILAFAACLVGIYTNARPLDITVEPIAFAAFAAISEPFVYLALVHHGARGAEIVINAIAKRYGLEINVRDFVSGRTAVPTKRRIRIVGKADGSGAREVGDDEEKAADEVTLFDQTVTSPPRDFSVPDDREA